MSIKGTMIQEQAGSTMRKWGGRKRKGGQGWIAEMGGRGEGY
jgi:hypothetical protein